MPIVMWALRGLGVLLSSWLFKVLASMAVGIATYAGVKVIIDDAKGYVINQIGALSADVINVLALLKVDVAINILFSAVIIRLTLTGMNAAGNFSRFKVGS